MNHLETFLSWSTLTVEIVLCGFVFVRGLQKLLPFFAVYASTLLLSTVCVWIIYERFGFSSDVSYYAYWISVLVNAVARSLAIVELCRYGLRAYQGIWALAWRVLSGFSVLLLAHAAIDAWGQPNALGIYGMTLDRDLAFSSMAILAILFVIRHYYGIALEPLQRMLAAGICFVCAVDVIANTIIHNILTNYLISFYQISQKALWPALQPQLERVDDVWSTIHLFSFMFTMGIWCYALRKPITSSAETPVLLPVEVYREMSPAVNLRLSAFNDRLVELLK